MRLAAALSLFALAACSNERATTSDAGDAEPAGHAATLDIPQSPPRLEPIWTASGFDSPEGVAAAPDGGWFISNVTGEGGALDGTGFVSILGEDGTIRKLKFAEGLNGPKGMAVSAGELFVSDIDHVRVYNARTGKKLREIAIDGAIFLNDATVWRGDIYVADSGTARIHRLKSGGAEIWREGDELKGVNGLLGDGERMLVSTMTSGSLFAAAADGGWREIASGMIDADGIGLAPGGGYLVSAWPGEIFYVTETGETTSLLNTRADNVLQNDLTVFGDIVIVPNWMPGTVSAWRLVR